MFQQGLAAAEARLAAGDWVHIFPEGTRSRDGKMGPVRKGVGRLVASCADAQPLIVPFVHTGMEEVLPKGALLPKANKEVRQSTVHTRVV
jgi:monolysocardiolipin acyltransferase